MGGRTAKIDLEVPRQNGLQCDPGGSLFDGHKLYEAVVGGHRWAFQEDPDVRNQKAIGRLTALRMALSQGAPANVNRLD